MSSKALRASEALIILDPTAALRFATSRKGRNNYHITANPDNHPPRVVICESCMFGTHDTCTSKSCPCVCNE